MHNVTSIVPACVTLHNIMQTCYKDDHQGLTPRTGRRTSQGALRQGAVLPDLFGPDRSNYATVAKRQRVYLSHYCNNPLGDVPWQNDMI